MIRLVAFAIVANIVIYLPASAKTFVEMFPQHTDLEAGDARNFLEGLDYKQGKISLPGGFAELQVPEGYYYLNPEHAERVLTEAWGNPPADEPPLGMIFPADLTPIHEGSWAVTVNWAPIGYVSDADAADTDYDQLLAEMQADARAESDWRRENGYEAIELLGWAAPPHYDAQNRRLHWAKELKFGAEQVHVLNYNMRILGRKGVLVMNFIAGMEALPEVQQALPDVLALASFTEGSRYSDFDASIDEVAAVGIGGLIAGKVLAKTGLLAAALIFLKKFWFLGFIALGGLWKMLTRRRS